MRFLILIILFSLICRTSLSQDTLFVNKHGFESPVQNVFEARETVYVKTTLSLYQLEEDKWERIEDEFSKPYVFFKDNFYESDFIPNSELFDISSIKELVPQRGKFIATAARSGSRFFIASGSELFEYEIRDHYTRSYHNMSIRDIFLEDSLKVISTYSGIFVNDSIRLSAPLYSNGPLSKIGSAYFFPWDEVSQFFPPDSTRLIAEATNRFAGKARKLISWNGETFALYTQSVAKILPGFELQPIHQGLEYLDLEVWEGGLVFSTFQGLCLKWSNGKTDTLAQLTSKIKDIYPAGDHLILSSDEGVYKFQSSKPDPVKLSDTPNTVMSSYDDFKNLWIATENGLYVLIPEFQSPILIIPNVEFNREALLLNSEILYVGAVDGLYTLNTYEIEKSYLPNLLNTIQVPIAERTSTWIMGSILAPFGFVIGWLFFRKRRKEALLSPKNGGKNELTLEDIKQKILTEKILTIESLANSLDTNTVQLNRNFKKLGTTPGKFLKKVKLTKAVELLNEGVNLEEVAIQVGYSTKFLKQELGI